MSAFAPLSRSVANAAATFAWNGPPVNARIRRTPTEWPRGKRRDTVSFGASSVSTFALITALVTPSRSAVTALPSAARAVTVNVAA
jgi:hypothetical protein